MGLHRVLFGALILCTLVLCCAGLSAAGPITYGVTVNTSSLIGTTGSLDFNFNPGPLAVQAASLQIVNFSSDGSVGGSPTRAGDVIGALPGTLTFDNGTAFNDYFGGFAFGSTISFNVSLYGPALSSPNGVSASGSGFAFSMFSDAAGAKPVLTSDTTSGFAFTVDVNLDGLTTVTNFSSQTSVQPVSSAVPEPGSAVLIGSNIALMGALFRLRRRASLLGC